MGNDASRGINEDDLELQDIKDAIAKLERRIALVVRNHGLQQITSKAELRGIIDENIEELHIAILKKNELKILDKLLNVCVHAIFYVAGNIHISKGLGR